MACTGLYQFDKAHQGLAHLASILCTESLNFACALHAATVGDGNTVHLLWPARSGMDDSKADTVTIMLVQVQPAAVVPSASTEGNARITAAAYAAEAAVPVATDNLVWPLAAELAPPDSAPAELAPAEPVAASATALAGSQPALGEGQSPGALVQQGVSLEQGGRQLSRGGSRTGSIGLLPQLKTQVEALEDKELELRL